MKANLQKFSNDTDSKRSNASVVSCIAVLFESTIFCYLLPRNARHSHWFLQQYAQDCVMAQDLETALATH